MSNKNNSKDVVSYFGPNTVIEGDIHSDGSLHIDGRLKGEIICNGDLILGETSKVYGKIKARNVLVSGYYKGTIESSEGLEIFPTGCVEGDIQGSKLLIQEGGVYKGKVNMDVIEQTWTMVKA